MTPTRPEIPAWERFCRCCGAEMEVLDVRRTLVPGRGWLPWLRRRWQWNADLACPRCGLRHGFGWAALVAYHPSRNPLLRLLRRVADLARSPMGKRFPRRPHSRYLRPDMTLDLARLLGDAPFAVLGLKGHPLDLRLRSPGWSGRDGDIRQVDLGYVAGQPRAPERALHVEQGRVDSQKRSQAAESGAIIHHLVANNAPRDAEEPSRHLEELNRDWNRERVEQAARRRVPVTIEGEVVEAEIASWEEPRRVNLARITLGDRFLVAASLGMSVAELVQALESLVTLQRDFETLEEHQRGFEAVSAELRKEHNDPARGEDKTTQ